VLHLALPAPAPADRSVNTTGALIAVLLLLTAHLQNTYETPFLSIFVIIFGARNFLKVLNLTLHHSRAASALFACFKLAVLLADTFAFDLRNAANTQSLLKLQLTPGINIQPGSYTLQSIAAGYGTNTIVDLSYQALFQVTVAMTTSHWNLSLSQINSTNRAVIASYTNLASGNLATGTTALDFATLGLNWDLASTNNLEPGSNYIIANQFTVVPEPRIWSLLALAAAVLAIIKRPRRLS
jgi:hypothetical protein